MQLTLPGMPAYGSWQSCSTIPAPTASNKAAQVTEHPTSVLSLLFAPPNYTSDFWTLKIYLGIVTSEGKAATSQKSQGETVPSLSHR